MTILTRYLLRAHIGPFLFAFTALTGLLLVNAVAEQLERLTGRGLPVEILLEAILLMLPHTIALTLPMALLTSVLYTVSEMATHNEIVAMSGAGVQPRRIFLPVLGFGLFICAATFLFNDRILPEANHRLKKPPHLHSAEESHLPAERRSGQPHQCRQWRRSLLSHGGCHRPGDLRTHRSRHT